LGSLGRISIYWAENPLSLPSLSPQSPKPGDCGEREARKAPICAPDQPPAVTPSPKNELWRFLEKGTGDEDLLKELKSTRQFILSSKTAYL
jgi:hypothetical protein